MQVLKHLSVLVISFITICCFANEPTEKNPVKVPIKLGTSVDLSGVNKFVGTSVKNGIELYLKKINAHGGVMGHTVELVALDDQYQPDAASQNVHTLTTDKNILALIGNLGIANVLISLPIIEENKTLLFGPIAGFTLNSPPQTYLFNVMTDYEQLQKSIFQDLAGVGYQSKDFAFFMQESGSGTFIYKSSMKAMKNMGYENVEFLPVGIYNPSTLNIEKALADILQQTKAHPPKVIIMAGIGGANEKFIKLANKELPHTIFLTETSIITAANLDPSLNDRVIHAQGVPSYAYDLPIAKEFLADCKTFNLKPNDVSFIAYTTAKLFLVGVTKAVANNHLSRTGIIEELESMGPVDIGIGQMIKFSKDNHQALNSAWTFRYHNGGFQAFNLRSLPKLPKIEKAVKAKSSKTNQPN